MKKPSFQYKTKPYKHQDEVFQESKDRRYFGLLWEMGTGKTKTLIDTIQWLWLKDEIDGILIVSDKGNYKNWIREEIPIHMPSDVPLRPAVWSAAMRKKERLRMERIMNPKEDTLDLMLANTESFSTNKAFEVAREFVLNHRTMIILDESTSIKSPKSKRSLNLRRLAQACKYRRIATGTPITQNPLDLFAQCQFLEPRSLGHSSFTAFRTEFAVLENVILGPRRFLKVAGFKNLEILTKRLRPFTSRILKQDCLDLPPKVYEKHYVDMTQEQWAAYNDIRDLAVLQLKEGLVTATAAMTIFEKLHQVTCGHIKTDEGATVNLPNNRIEELDSLLEIVSDKVIVWCAYQRDVQLIMEMLSQKKPYYGVHYYGLTDEDQRAEAIDRFMKDEFCRWFVGTPKTGGKGLTLTVAANVIYYSNTYNLEHRLQSEDRAHRIGQNRKVTYIDMIAPRTLDQRICKALASKQDLARMVIDPEFLKTVLDTGNAESEESSED